MNNIKCDDEKIHNKDEANDDFDNMMIVTVIIMRMTMMMLMITHNIDNEKTGWTTFGPHLNFNRMGKKCGKAFM